MLEAGIVKRFAVDLNWFCRCYKLMKSPVFKSHFQDWIVTYL